MSFKQARGAEQGLIGSATQLCRCAEECGFYFHEEMPCHEFGNALTDMAASRKTDRFFELATKKVRGFMDKFSPTEKDRDVTGIDYGVMLIWAQMKWAYNGFNIIRLTRDDLYSIVDLHQKIDSQDVELADLVSGKFPFSAALVELEDEVLFQRSWCEFEGEGIITQFMLFAQFPVDPKIQKHRIDPGEVMLCFGMNYDDEIEAAMHGVTDPFVRSMNYFLTEFSLKGSPGKRTKTGYSKKDKRRWVRPKVWLPHEPSNIHIDPKTITPVGGAESGPIIEIRDGPGKSPARHHRRGYWGWHPYGPGRSLRKLTWHRPTIVNAHNEVMATRSYETDPK